jgi:hypothetical protein
MRGFTIARIIIGLLPTTKSVGRAAPTGAGVPEPRNSVRIWRVNWSTLDDSDSETIDNPVVNYLERR